MDKKQRIAIVGVGGVFPGATDLDVFWENITKAKDLSQEPPEGRWLLSIDDCYEAGSPKADKVYSKRACFVEDFILDRKGLDIDTDLLNSLDPMYHLLLHAGRDAWEDTKTASIDKERVGIIIGNIALPTESSSALADELIFPVVEQQLSINGSEPSQVNKLNRYVTGLPAGLLARSLGLGGCSYTLDAACASSLYALKYAVDELISNRADAMLTGGLSRPDPLYTQMGFSALHAISASGHCSPFDSKADGLVVGEGSGIVVLKRLDDAIRDQDTIYATIEGIGLSNDIGGNLMSPDSEGQLRAMQAAYQQADWSPSDVELIECHGTGTPVGDATEFNSLCTLWQDNKREKDCVIGSIKSNIGHLLTAAGSAGLIKILLAMKHEQLPPTANFSSANSKMDLEASPFTVLSQTIPWDQKGHRRAAISAFGFGGINAHVLLQEWKEESKKPASQPISKNEDKAEIAIVGLDACFGPWKSLKDFQKRIFNQDTNLKPGTIVNSWGIDTRIKGYSIDEITVPLGRFRIPPTELEDMLPQQLLMLQVAANAIEDAGVNTKNHLIDTGVYIGIGLDLNTTNFHMRWRLLQKARQWIKVLAPGLTSMAMANWVDALRDCLGPPLTANRTMGALGGIVASRIARAFNIGGPSFTLSNEEASGLRALEAGVRALQRAEINQAIVGAVDLASDIRALAGQHDSRPYTDENIVGDGAAAVILKRHEDAIRDGDHIYAIVKGIAGSTNANSTAVIPEKDGYIDAVDKSLNDANLSINDVKLVEMHGSMDAEELAMEESALHSLFDHYTSEIPCALGNIKNDVGHTGAAGGLAAIIKTCLALRNKTIPQSRHQGFQDHKHLYSPTQPMYWLRNKVEGPRVALVNSFSVDGNCISAVLSGSESSEYKYPCVAAPVLFSIEGNSADELSNSLIKLQAEIAAGHSLNDLAYAWDRENQTQTKLAVSLIANDEGHLSQLTQVALDTVINNESLDKDFIYYNPAPSGPKTKVAFVFPGSGNHYQNMGKEAAIHWPTVINHLDQENDFLASQFAETKFWLGNENSLLSQQDVIFGQVWLGTLMSDIVSSFNIKPSAIIGYSLGETAGLFATRSWTDRDLMLERIKQSDLFTEQLAGNCDSARRAWELDNDNDIDWLIGVVTCEATKLKESLKGRKQVYLLIINTDKECVIGGNRHAVQSLIDDLDCYFHPIEGVTTVHCEVAKPVEKPYRDLHLFDTHPPKGVAFYSGILGGPYELTKDSAADSIIGQALHWFDYTKVINRAYEDGVRFFIEMGPGNTCSRMIDQILGERPHAARAVSVKGQSEVLNVLRVLAKLNSERIPVDLSSLYEPASESDPYMENQKISVVVGKRPFQVPFPTGVETKETDLETRETRVLATSPESGTEIDNVISIPAEKSNDNLYSDIINQMSATEQSKAEAQEIFLKVSNGMSNTLAQALSIQATLIQSDPNFSKVLTGIKDISEPVTHDPVLEKRGSPTEFNSQYPAPLFDRNKCMEIAIGSIANVLGPKFAEVDNYPTRVRLPDEPLMLVDRIMEIEGEPGSMSNGRVVTEHDVHPGAWYLDAGRIPTCIAVEAGQADLFLSGYLGIDLITKGQAVYRLLDAEVTFHGPLPKEGQTIQYNIYIDHFFQQGETYLFRFYFDGTVNGETLITMRNGCAGFFTQAELDAGQGIVLTSLEKQTHAGTLPDNWTTPVEMVKESYTEEQIDALRKGDLVTCFGGKFKQLDISTPATLPGDRMTLVHRVLDLDPAGGRFGIGQITGEADIHPDDWFLSCHFVDDQVMPGTLMYECCLHTLRIYLLRMGWIGEASEFVYEPIAGVSSKLKCRGQVTADTKKVQYEITLKEIGYQADGNTPFVIAEALMYADGRPVVQMSNMSLQLSGLRRERIEALWKDTNITSTTKQILFDYDSIHSFAVGRPSDAFGQEYSVFDNDRVIARLPGPPFQFLDRIVSIENCEQWKLNADGIIEAEYDVPEDAWYFDEGRSPNMPFSVLLEIALQPCGWLAAYLGSALTSQEDLSFRNLGGEAVQSRMVTNHSGTLHTTIKITNVSSSGGMIIQHYDYHVRCGEGDVYKGSTYFGFFTKGALSEQIGIRDVELYTASGSEHDRAKHFTYPDLAPYPKKMLRMVDKITLFIPDGGPQQLGFIEGISHVDADDWFYKAHFHQDPVWPGSLGLESFIQLLKVVALHHWGKDLDPDEIVFESMPCGDRHRWLYRGQILPVDSTVTVQAMIMKVDNETKSLCADGYLSVDGRIIYQMNDFTLRIRDSSQKKV